MAKEKDAGTAEMDIKFWISNLKNTWQTEFPHYFLTEKDEEGWL